MTATLTTTKRPRKSSRRSFGAVRKLPSGKFQARYLDDTGTMRTAPSTFATTTAADEWLTTERADILRGTYRSPDLGSVTLADYFTEWLANRTDLAPKTREQYADRAERWILRDLALPQSNGRKPRTVNLGTRPLNTLNVSAIREWLAAAHNTQVTEKAERRSLAEHHRDTRQHPARIWARQHGMDVNAQGRISPAILKKWKRAGSPLPAPDAPTIDLHAKRATVIAQAYRALRASLNAAVRDGLIVANPCQIPNAGTDRAAERVPATTQEINFIADAMPPRFSAAVHLATWTGLRAGELFALTRAHVDLEHGTVRVERAIQELRGQVPTFGPPKTDASRRTVHVPPHVVEILRAHLDTFTPKRPDALVFGREDGTVLPAVRRTALFRRARAAAGRPDLRWHDLRHTGATLAAQAGASVRELQSRLGHSTIVAAMRYQHASAERDREIAHRLSDLASPNNVVRLHHLA